MNDSLKKQVDGSHYKDMGIQPWEIIAKNKLDYFEGAALKYLLRWKEKDGVIDLDKIIHYIERIKEMALAGNYGEKFLPKESQGCGGESPKECEHTWIPFIRHHSGKIPETIRYDCKKCGQSKPVETHTQTLAERIKYNWDHHGHNTRQEASECFARLAESHYLPLIEAAENNSKYGKGVLKGIELGRKSEREELHAKFANLVEDFKENRAMYGSYTLNEFLLERLFDQGGGK